jgi:phosphopantetheinyl transferase
MIQLYHIHGIETRIWSSPLDAPICEDPKRDALVLETRKKEWDAVAQCLPPHLCMADILKDPNGKPYLKNGNHISISHSGAFAAVAVSEKVVGVDIQIPRSTVFRVRQKFCHPTELSFVKDDPMDERFMMLWCAKEAIFKMYGSGIDFAQDLCSQSFETGDSNIIIHQQSPHHKNDFIEVHFLKNPHYFVAIAQIQKK